MRQRNVWIERVLGGIPDAAPVLVIGLGVGIPGIGNVVRHGRQHGVIRREYILEHAAIVGLDAGGVVREQVVGDPDTRGKGHFGSEDRAHPLQAAAVVIEAHAGIDLELVTDRPGVLDVSGDTDVGGEGVVAFVTGRHVGFAVVGRIGDAVGIAEFSAAGVHLGVDAELEVVGAGDEVFGMVREGHGDGVAVTEGMVVPGGIHGIHAGGLIGNAADVVAVGRNELVIGEETAELGFQEGMIGKDMQVVEVKDDFRRSLL